MPTVLIFVIHKIKISFLYRIATARTCL